MKKFFYPTFFLFTISCSSEGNKGESNLNQDQDSTQQVTTESNSLNAVTAFLNLNPDLFGSDYCYDLEAISELIMNDNISEFGWYSKLVNEDSSYLKIENNECYSTLTFSTFERGSKKCAFLSMMTKSVTEFHYLENDPSTNTWEITDGLPEVYNWDFFDNPAIDQTEVIAEYGVFGAHITEEGKGVSYIFYDWQMGQRLQGSIHEGFDVEPAYDIQLKWDNEKFWTEKVAIQ